MEKKKCDVYAPLELLKKTTAGYPNVWKQMEQFHNENGIGESFAWPEWCYAPLAAAITVATSGIPLENSEKIISALPAAQSIAALASWRLSKEVFVMDPDLELLLYKQIDDLDICPEVLTHLPYPCFYVQTSTLFCGSDKIEGFFVHLEFDMEDGHRELRFLFVREDRTVFGYPIYIDAKDIRNSIEQTLKQTHPNTVSDLSYQRTHENLASLETLLKESLQLVLYLCSENVEIDKNPEQDTFMRRSNLVVRDRYAEIRKWDVGVRIGRAMRRYKQMCSISADGSEPLQQTGQISFRSHLCRGCWCDYWIKSSDGGRKLALKWIEPTFVGVSGDNSSAADSSDV